MVATKPDEETRRGPWLDPCRTAACVPCFV